MTDISFFKTLLDPSVKQSVDNAANRNADDNSYDSEEFGELQYVAGYRKLLYESQRCERLCRISNHECITKGEHSHASAQFP